MAKKQKEKKPTFTFGDKEYIIEDMSDDQRAIAAKVLKLQDHVNDIQKKLQTNMFIKEQFVENGILSSIKYSAVKQLFARPLDGIYTG